MKPPKFFLVYLVFVSLLFTSSCSKSPESAEIPEPECPFTTFDTKTSKEEIYQNLDHSLNGSFLLPFFKKLNLSGAYSSRDQYQLIVRDSSYYTSEFIMKHNGMIAPICGCLMHLKLADSSSLDCDTYIKAYLDLVFQIKEDTVPSSQAPKPKIDFISNKQFKNSDNNTELAVLILNEDDSINRLLTHRVSEIFNKPNFKVCTNLFNDRFIIRKKFHRLFKHADDLEFLQAHADHVILGKVKTATIPSHETIKNWTSIQSELQLTVINTASGKSHFMPSYSTESLLNPTQALHRSYDSLFTTDFITELSLL